MPMASGSAPTTQPLGGNRTSLISRITDDALVEIFRYHKPENHASINHPFDTWLNIIHVCRRWRMVAIGYASWWTNIITSDPDLAAFMLGNSRNAPLVFDLDMTSERRATSYARRLVKANLPRIRFLRISFLRSSEASRILQTLNHTKYPMLVEIFLRHSDTRPRNATSLPADVLPLELSGILRLDNCWFSPSVGAVCHRLTSLTVKALVRETISTISNTPALVNLSVLTPHDYSLHRLPFHPRTEDDIVRLSHLRQFEFSGPIVDYLQLVEWVHIPLESSLSIATTVDSRRPGLTGEQPMARLLEHIRDRFSRREEVSEGIRRLHVDVHMDDTHGSTDSTAIHAFTDRTEALLPANGIPQTLLDPTSRIRSDFTFKYIDEDGTSNVSEVARHVCRHLPLESVAILCIGAGNDHYIGPAWWPSCFEAVQEIKHLAVRGDRLVCFLVQFLNPDFLSDYPGPYTHLDGDLDDDLSFIDDDELLNWVAPLQNLHTLSVESAGQLDNRHGDYPMNEILESLQSRDAARLPRLHLLSISECDVSAETVEKLEGLVDKLVWDGKEDGWTDVYGD
ncbi:uncharacterized protein STEHIDRAFT_140956 [Stereum hirsutum FP-91666 SS1]|uniref:uncharacterized protein n=1 Tax=Stereum hirsutum (strain FP-91666) TaxID=721885 RepID=UPI0004449AF7|nr:uncharacterized protein STEHIDRAFT_140956 [Stereum hirsutum FP-91666 SS1]EIM84005.1 hypothetical protein STEHIDRAFT_140956 [Stereum hirsutum FP-91666 SS1]